jgi:hypothetical protein
MKSLAWSWELLRWFYWSVSPSGVPSAPSRRCASPVIAFVTPDRPEGLSYDEWRYRAMVRGAIEVTHELWPSGHHAEIGPKVK